MSSDLLNDLGFIDLIKEIRDTAAELTAYVSTGQDKVIFFARLATLSHKVTKAVNLVARDDDFADVFVALDKFIARGR